MEGFAELVTIGSGSSATVLKARRISGIWSCFVIRFEDNVTVALKQIPFGGLSKKEIDDAVNEVKILQTLMTTPHPNVIDYYESFVQSDTLHIVMEFAEGNWINSTHPKGGDLHTEIVQAKKQKSPFDEDVIIYYHLHLANNSVDTTNLFGSWARSLPKYNSSRCKAKKYFFSRRWCKDRGLGNFEGIEFTKSIPPYCKLLPFYNFE